MNLDRITVQVTTDGCAATGSKASDEYARLARERIIRERKQAAQ